MNYFSYNPTDADFISSLVSGSLSVATGYNSFARGSLIQYITLVLARNITDTTRLFEITDSHLFQEIHLWTAFIRFLITAGVIYKRDAELRWNDPELIIETLAAPGTAILGRLLTQSVVLN